MSREARHAFAVVLAAIAVSAAELRAQGETVPLAFTNITVIDGTGAPAQPGMTVIVAGDRIWGLGRTDSLAVPAHSTVIDAHGRYLVPGLWDMHAHLDDALWREGYNTAAEKETFLALLVANGVTGVRLPGDFIEQVNVWKHRILVGDLLGPRIVAADRPLEGGDLPFPGWVRVETEAEARAAVRSQVRRGADFIKVYDGLTREAYFAIANEAGRLGVDFAGHPPYVVSAVEAAAAGQKSIEHLTGTTYQCTERAAELQAGAATAFRMTRALHDAGVRLLAGTDFATVPFTFPGFSLHDELAHLVDAGLTPMEALQTATLNPALYLGRAHSGGTVELGKLADLVLLDADPLEDIRNTRRIRGVVLNGRYLDRDALDEMMAGVERFVRGPGDRE